MSMVKAYHGKQCTDLQLCCSNWRESNSLSKNDLLTKDIEMGEEEDENWLWDSTSRKSLSDNERQESDQNLNQSKYLPLDPPVEFQDNPTTSPLIDEFADDFISKLIADVLLVSCKITWSIPCSQDCHMSGSLPLDNSALWNGLRLCWTPELLPYNKSQNNFPGCLSASHNSLSTIGSSNIDETAHIKSALSHDALTTNEISDMYNVPFDSDIYSVPVDQISKTSRSDKWSFRNKCWASPVPSSHHYFSLKERNSSQKLKEDVSGRRCIDSAKKSHRSNGGASSNEPIHVTVEEVRQYLRTLYSRAGNEGSENRNFQDTIKRLKNPFKTLQNHNNINQDENRFLSLKVRSKYIIPARSKKAKENVDTSSREYSRINERFKKANTCRPSFSTNIKETLCNIFRIKRLALSDHCLWRREPGSRSDEIGIRLSGYDDHNPPSSPITKPPFSKRALPPLPKLEDNHGEIIVTDSTPLPSPEGFLPPRSTVSAAKRRTPVVAVDFASSIEKVKDYGWYWGPISGEEAEKILSNEPDGSFIVRDSSDDYYIFSLTFKLNSIIRHVRIEHDQGNFSFGSSRFKSHTIVDFIESAVEHSRSGRYLFFLHRRPVLGPMRVQLLHPVSRFKQVQSLQHKCRFVILKMVRRDLIQKLPLPKRLLDYLSSPHYYWEHLVCEDQSDSSSKDDLDQLLSSDQEGFS